MNLECRNYEVMNWDHENCENGGAMDLDDENYGAIDVDN